MPSSAPSTPAVRRLRAPIRGLLTGDDVQAFMAAQQEKKNNDMNTDESRASAVSVVADSSVQRMLQDGAPQSEFGLEVGLQGINGSSGAEDSNSDGPSTIAVATIVLIALAAGGFGIVYWTKRSRKEEPKDLADHHSSNASVGTYPNQASVYSSSSSQNISHRARDQQVD